MQLLLSSGTLYKTHSLTQTEQLALELGYDGIELMMPPRLKETSETTGNIALLTTVRVVHAPNDFYNRTRFTIALDDAVTLAKTVRAPLVNIHPASRYYGGRDTVLHCIKRIQQVQSTTGIIIAYEVLGKSVGTDAGWHEHIHRQEAYTHPDQWLEDVRRYSLNATLDTSHIATWDEDPTKYVNQLGPLLKHIHVSDFEPTSARTHLSLGNGSIDFEGFFLALTKVNPDCTVTVEVNPCVTAQESLLVAQENIAFIRRVLA